MIWCRQLQLSEAQLACLRNPNSDSIAEFNRCLRVPAYAAWPAQGMNLRVSNPHVQSSFNAFSGDISAATECGDLTLAALNQHTNVDVQSYVGRASRFMQGFAPWLADNRVPSNAVSLQNLAAYRRVLSRSLDGEIRDLARIPNAEVLQYISLVQFLTGGNGNFYQASSATPSTIYHAVNTRPHIQVQPVQLLCPPAPTQQAQPTASYSWQHGAAGATALIALGAGAALLSSRARTLNYTPASEQAFIDDLRLRHRGNARVLGFLAGWEAQRAEIEKSINGGHPMSTMPAMPADADATSTIVEPDAAIRARLFHSDEVYRTGYEAGARAAHTNYESTLAEAQARVDTLRRENAEVSRQLNETETRLHGETTRLSDMIESVSRSLVDEHDTNINETRRSLLDALIGMDRNIRAHAGEIHDHFRQNMIDRFTEIHRRLGVMILRIEREATIRGGEQPYRGVAPAVQVQNPILVELKELRGSVAEILTDLNRSSFAAVAEQFRVLEGTRLTSGHPSILEAVQEHTRPYSTDTNPGAAPVSGAIPASFVAPAPATSLSHNAGPQAGSATDSQGPTLADAVVANLQEDPAHVGNDGDWAEIGNEVRTELNRRGGGGGTSGETRVRSFLEDVLRDEDPWRREAEHGVEGERVTRGRIGR